MRNDFLAHEADFKIWVKGWYQPGKDATAEFLHHLADPNNPRKPKPGGLWPHQWKALLRVIYAKEVVERDFWEGGLLLNIVTGGGKTALIAATMAWLRLAHDVQRFLILCPNLIVRDRLEEDFRHGKVFRERGLIPPWAVVQPDYFALTTLGGESRNVAANLFGANVILANIHQFHLNSRLGQENLWGFLEASQTPFAIFNDEAHNSPAPQYDRVLQELQEHAAYSFRLDTTATPERADDTPLRSQMIYEFDIPKALKKEVIATPVVYQPDIKTVELTYRDAGTGESKRFEEIDWDEVDRVGLNATQWVTDPEPMSQQIRIALNRLDEAKRSANGRYQPILFVVAICKADARAAAQMLKSQFKLKTLLVTEDSPDEARKEAAAIGRSGNYDAVVSVAMLREGWDVPEVGVILLLRKFGSKVYGPQVVGRGLRRVRREKMDPAEPQFCAVVDHPKLGHEWLWELLQARVRTEVAVGDEFDETKERPPKRNPQKVVKPENHIEIPEPDEAPPPPPPDREAPKEPARNWMELLLGFEYENVEITGVELNGVTARVLAGIPWEKLLMAPEQSAGIDLAPLTEEQLQERIREWLAQVAEDSVEQAGYGRRMRRYVEAGLRDYLISEFLGGEEICYASKENLRQTVLRLNQLEAKLLQRPDIIGGMVKYGD